MVFTSEDVKKIVKHMEDGLDIVGGLCKRGEGGYYAAWNAPKDGDYETIEEFPGGVFEVGAVGAGFLAINKQVIEKMQCRPFNTITVNGFLQGEDISFCYKAMELGFKVWIDSSIRIGHIRHSILY